MAFKNKVAPIKDSAADSRSSYSRTSVNESMSVPADANGTTSIPPLLRSASLMLPSTESSIIIDVKNIGAEGVWHSLPIQLFFVAVTVRTICTIDPYPWELDVVYAIVTIELLLSLYMQTGYYKTIWFTIDVLSILGIVEIQYRFYESLGYHQESSRGGVSGNLLRVLHLIRVLKAFKPFAQRSEYKRQIAQQNLEVTSRIRSLKAQSQIRASVGMNIGGHESRGSRRSAIGKIDVLNNNSRRQRQRLERVRPRIVRDLEEIIAYCFIGLLLIFMTFLPNIGGGGSSNESATAFVGNFASDIVFTSNSLRNELLNDETKISVLNSFLDNYPDTLFVKIQDKVWVEKNTTSDIKTANWATDWHSKAFQTSDDLQLLSDDCILVDESYLLEILRKDTVLRSIVFFVVILIGIGTFGRVARKLFRSTVEPIDKIATDMERVALLDFKNHLHVESDAYEIDLILDAYERMKIGLESFSRYLPNIILKDILQNHTVGKSYVVQKTVSLLFVDIRNFKSIMNSLTTTQLRMLMKEYYSFLESVLAETKGFLTEFVDDSCLCIWNNPVPNNEHAFAAISTALTLRRRLRSANRAWERKGSPTISIRCGMHTDTVFVGCIGAHQRKKYGVLGDAVNIASKVHELTSPHHTDILISQAMLSHPKVNTFKIKKVQSASVETSAGDLGVYQVSEK